MIITELYYTDIYPKQFEEFRKKYAKVDNHNLYVQFTNFAKTTLEKSPYQNPDHKDPVGIYAYPLDYVLKYPADIWYGRNCNFLRVIQLTSPEKLVLNYVDEDKARSLLYKAFGYIDDKILKEFRKKFKPTNWAKLFFSVIQYEHTAKDTFTIRSGIEQTNILKKMGITVIEDQAKTNSKY